MKSMKVLKDLNVIKSYLIMLKENMFKPKKQFRSEDDDDEQLFEQFQEKLMANLKARSHQVQNLEDLGDSVRILSKKVPEWSQKQWIQVLKKKKVDEVSRFRSMISLSIKSIFPQQLRPRIWIWLGQIEKYDDFQPYTLYSELKATQSKYDGLIRQDVIRSLQSIKYFKTKKLKKQQQQQLQNFIESQKSINEISDDQLLMGMTEGQKKLFYVLRAYANYDDTVGYAQGMNYLGAILIYYLDSMHYKNKELSLPLKDYCELDQEVYTFLLLIHINKQKKWSDVYSRKMRKIKSLLNFLETKIGEVIPEVLEQIRNTNEPFQVFFEAYFFTLLGYKSPIEFTVRIMDIFLLEGESIIFEVILRLLYFNRRYIESLESPEEVISFLKNDLISYSLKHYQISQIIPLDHFEIINEY